MKLLRSLSLTAALCIFAVPAAAQTGPLVDFWVYVSGGSGGAGFWSIPQIQAGLSGPLVPAMADQTFLCNNAGVSAVPIPCSFGTGLAVSGGVLSATATPYTFSIGTPNTRTLSFSTAYQASTTTKPASVNINLTSTASISISGGSTNTATVYIGSTSAVASGTGTPICNYSNSNTGTLTIGLNLSTIAAVPCHLDLPVGWFFAILQQSGTVTISSAYDQSMG